jgi:hypothetical protein
MHLSWTVAAARSLGIYFRILCISWFLGIVLCWNSKYQRMGEIPAVSLGNLDVSLPFWHGTVERIQDILSASTSLHSESGQQVFLVNWNCLESVRRVSVCDFSAEVDLSMASLWTESKISAVKSWDYEYWLWFMCVCICMYIPLQLLWYNYSVCSPAVTWWRDSWSHCCSRIGLWRIFIPAWPFNCKQSWTDAYTKGMHYDRRSAPLYMNLFLNVDCWYRVVGMAVDWKYRMLEGARIEVLVLWWNRGLNIRG